MSMNNGKQAAKMVVGGETPRECMPAAGGPPGDQDIAGGPWRLLSACCCSHPTPIFSCSFIPRSALAAFHRYYLHLLASFRVQMNPRGGNATALRRLMTEYKQLTSQGVPVAECRGCGCRCSSLVHAIPIYRRTRRHVYGRYDSHLSIEGN